MAFEFLFEKSGITFALHSHTGRINTNLFENFTANFTALLGKTESKQKGITSFYCTSYYILHSA